MREFDEVRLERLLRDTLHAEADVLPLDVDADTIVARWRTHVRGRSRRRALMLLGVAAVLMIPVAMFIQGGGRTAVVESPSSSPGPSAAPPSFDPAAYPGWLAYSVGGAGPDPGYREIRLVQVDGTDDHGIQDPWTEPWDEAEWSVDGRTLLFVRERTDQRLLDVFEYDLATATTRELVHCDPDPPVLCAQTNEASYAPDGRRIVYFYAEGAPDGEGIPTDCGIRVLTIATGETEDLTRHACGLIEDRHPRWSPDGTRVAFYRTQQPTKGGPVTGSAVFVRDLATGEETQLTEWDVSRAEELDWSPDAEWIAFMDGTPGDLTTGRLSRIRPDGTGFEVLHSLGDGVAPFRPRFTFDGAWILVSDLRGGPDEAGGHLFAIPATGGDADEFLQEFPGNPFIYGTLQPTP
jgi:Tol biopolymer transport system component